MIPSQPAVPLPKALMSVEPSTWAHHTVSKRLPEIAGRILSENALPPELARGVRALIDALPDEPLHLLTDPGAPDLEVWNGYLRPYLGQSWLQVPWFLAEHTFYRRLMVALGYFQAGPGWALDPFFYQKRQGLALSWPAIRNLVDTVSGCLGSERPQPELMVSLFYQDLWGNQADLSLWPAEAGEKPDHAGLEQAQAFLLADDASKVADYLLSLPTGVARVDLLLDNAGFELVADLVVADTLLRCGLAREVCLHVKAHPTFVSDALRQDVAWTLLALKSDEHFEVSALGGRLLSALDDGRLALRPDFFWTSPQPAWQMPADLRLVLGQADLVISKGDANYRRLLGDRDWPYTTPFEAIMAYFPAPILALRTLKAELVCGLQPGQAEATAAQDPDWLVAGRWGVVQFSKGG